MTSYPAGTRGDGISIKISAVEVPILAIAGAVPGVTPLAAGGTNGPGVGYMQQDDGANLLWRAPGSSAYGAAINVSAGGSYLLEDGTDPKAWIRVSVSVANQSSSPNTSEVHLQDIFNTLGPDDVSAAEASAGTTDTMTVVLTNTSGARVDVVTVWIDAAAADLSISDDNITFVTPTSEGAGLLLGSIAVAGTDTLYIKRIISAAATADPDVLNNLHLSWEGT